MDPMPPEHPPYLVFGHISQCLSQQAPAPGGMPSGRFTVNYGQDPFVGGIVIDLASSRTRCILKACHTVFGKPVRHLLTVAGRTLRFLAITLVASPFAAERIICALNTNRCSVLVERTQRSRVRLASAVNVMEVTFLLIQPNILNIAKLCN